MYDTAEKPADGELSKETASTLPTPCGYKILIGLAQLKKETDGGILLDEGYLEKERAASVLGFVLRVGPDAYSDPRKFPNGPWCKKGDWVLINPYAGVKITVFGQEFRLVNDDVIEATVENPMGIGRPGGVGSKKPASVITPTASEAIAINSGALERNT